MAQAGDRASETCPLVVSCWPTLLQANPFTQKPVIERQLSRPHFVLLYIPSDWNLEWGAVDRRRKEKRPDRTANPQNSTRLGTPEGLVPVVYQEWGVVEGAPTAA